jgi:predicted secreted protein
LSGLFYLDKDIPMFRAFLCFVVSFFIFNTAAIAEEQSILSLSESRQTLLNLSATETTEVKQDVLVANLRIEKEGRDPAELQNTVNEMMKKAISMAKEIEAIDVETEQYYVHARHTDRGPVHDQEDMKRREKSKIWRASQGFRLKSLKPEPLLELAGELQSEGFLMGGLHYQLSSEKREQIRDSLIEGALEKIQARAKRVGLAINKKTMSLVEINVDTGQNMMVQPMMRGMAMAESAQASAPVAQPGKNEISLNVTAKVLLSE